MKLFFLILSLLFVLPAFGTDEDEQMLEKLEAEKAKQIEQAMKLQKATKPLQSPFANMNQQLEKMGLSSKGSIFDEKTIAMLEQALAASPLYDMSSEQVRALILEKVKGKPLEKVFGYAPVLLDISVDVLRDRTALPSLLKVLRRKEDLKTYGYVWIGLVTLGFLIRWLVFSKKWSFMKRFTARTILSLALVSASLFVFYSTFQKEVDPTVKIFKRHLF